MDCGRDHGLMEWCRPVNGRHQRDMTKKQTRETDRMLQQNFGDRLRQARVKRGFEVQAEFARKIQVINTRYNMWENGKSVPNTIGNLMDLCDTLGVTADWLLFGRTGGLSQEAYQLLVTSRSHDD